MGVSFDTTSATIVVPIMAASLEDVALQWEAAVGAGADIVEWRIDALGPHLWDAETVGESGAALRAQFGKPVLATMRTAKEGGGFTGSAAQYRSILRDAGGWADLVDVEVGYRGAEELIAELRGRTAVVGSFHDFTTEPSAATTVQLLSQMQDLGCGVGKVAWMVTTEADLALVKNLQVWAAEHMSMPTVVIGMGPLGTESRLGNSALMSAFTFARGSVESAPGQPTVEEIRASVI